LKHLLVVAALLNVFANLNQKTRKNKMLRRHCAATSAFIAARSSPLALLAPSGIAATRRVESHFRETLSHHPLGDKFVKQSAPTPTSGEYAAPMEHEIWTKQEVAAIKQTTRPRDDWVDSLAYGFVQMLRFCFDVASGYKFGKLTERKILVRMLYLETVAAVPGMVAGALRHLKSLRTMERDGGWIATLLAESQNERMHMLTFLQLYKPGVIFRFMVLVAQLTVWNLFFVSYLISPRFVHRLVAHLEEQAVVTYMHAISCMKSENDELRAFGRKPAPDIAKRYWKLADDATMLEVIEQVLADEANHRDVNHTFANMNPRDISPFVRREECGTSASSAPSSSSKTN
jgi:hypothetical protein